MASKAKFFLIVFTNLVFSLNVVATIEFHPMTSSEKKSFIEKFVDEYSSELYSSVSFRKKTRLSYKNIYDKVSKELFSIDQNHLYVIKYQQQDVGIIWYSVKSEYRDDTGWLNYIFINPNFRGNGFGKKAMQLMENRLSSKQYVGLTVLKNNVIAKNLYKKLGYEQNFNIANNKQDIWEIFTKPINTESEN